MSDEYFATTGGERPEDADEPRYVDVEGDVPRLEAAPGVYLSPVFGRNLTMSFVFIEPNSVAPVHDHAEEQIGVILGGTCEFELAGEVRTLRTGDVYVAPPYVPHGARTGAESCRILDAFSPPREAFRELMKQQHPPK